MGPSRPYRELTPSGIVSMPDGELDDQLWQHVLDRGDVSHQPAAVQAWYATRLFEWESAAEGPDAFWTNVSDLADAVADGYRRLDLPDAAAAFDRLRSSPLVRRLLDDPDWEPSDPDLAALAGLTDAIGRHDAARVAFVRAHPDTFLDPA